MPPLLFSMLLLLGAHGEEIALPFEGKPRRLAESHERIATFLAAQEASGALAATLTTLEGIEDDDSRWICSESGCARRHDLARYRKWNRRSKDDPEVRAVQIEAEHHPYGAIVDAARQLEERGILLVVFALPAPYQIYPEFIAGLPKEQRFPGLNPGTSRFLLRLLDAGVEVVPSFAAFASDRGDLSSDPYDGLFFRGDTHWTPRGARLAAKLLSDYVRTIPGFERRGDLPLELDPVYVTDHRFVGDLEAPAFRSERIEVRAVRGAGPECVDDRASPLLLLGDSFGFIHEMQLGSSVRQFLCFELGRSIDSICLSGGGDEAVRQALARRRDGLEGKRLVIWMLPNDLGISARWRPLPLFDPREER